eukprot:747017-Hanusia_phi.AAC.2
MAGCSSALRGLTRMGGEGRTGVHTVHAIRSLSSAADKSSSSPRSSRISKFHALTVPQRLAALHGAGFVSQETLAALEGEGLELKQADQMIENVLGTFKMPMGAALNMVVNGRE